MSGKAVLLWWVSVKYNLSTEGKNQVQLSAQLLKGLCHAKCWNFMTPKCQKSIFLYIGVTSSILIGYKHAANSCLLCFSYVIPTNNSFMHAEVTSPDTLTSSLISFVMAELSSGICIIKQLLNSVFAC